MFCEFHYMGINFNMHARSDDALAILIAVADKHSKVVIVKSFTHKLHTFQTFKQFSRTIVASFSRA